MVLLSRLTLLSLFDSDHVSVEGSECFKSRPRRMQYVCRVSQPRSRIGASEIPGPRLKWPIATGFAAFELGYCAAIGCGWPSGPTRT
jgi:hypothetical protein